MRRGLTEFPAGGPPIDVVLTHGKAWRGGGMPSDAALHRRGRAEAVELRRRLGLWQEADGRLALPAPSNEPAEVAGHELRPRPAVSVDLFSTDLTASREQSLASLDNRSSGGSP